MPQMDNRRLLALWAKRRAVHATLFGRWRMANAAPIAGVLLAVACCPATSRAAVLTTNEFGHALYVADSGERNQVTVTPILASTRVSDPGARIRVSGGCRLLDTHTAECDNTSTDIKLGDMDDTVASVSGEVWLFADGGPGNDTLTAGPGHSFNSLVGGPGDDTLTGSEGGEELIGGPGHDKLAGSGGDDVLVDGDTPGAPHDDTLDGGAGPDEVTHRLEAGRRR